MTTATMQASPAAPATIPQLLKQFAKQPGCDRYKGDAEQVNMLSDYLWLRQLVPSLPFETFLACYQPVADFSEENCKHPEHAIRTYLPRSKAVATKVGRAQWSSEQAVGCLSLYVDMIRSAERQNIPVPVDLKTFLEGVGPRYLNGEFDPPEAAKGKKKKAAEPAANGQAPPATPPAETAAAAPAAAPATAPPPATPGATLDNAFNSMSPPAAAPPAAALQPGSPIVYTAPGGRQIPAVLEEIVHDANMGRDYATFSDLHGERYSEVNLKDIRPATEADRPLPQPAQGPEICSHRLLIVAVDNENAARALAMTVPYGTVELGKPIQTFQTPLTPSPYLATIDVVNGETGPYVDAYVHDVHGNVKAEVPTRQNLLGEYAFTLPEGIARVTLWARQRAVPAPVGSPAVPAAPPPGQMPSWPPPPPGAVGT